MIEVMADLTEEQRMSIDVLQSEQDPDITCELRIAFMSRVLSVSNADLAATPQPAPVKRGRRRNVDIPQIPAG